MTNTRNTNNADLLRIFTDSIQSILANRQTPEDVKTDLNKMADSLKAILSDPGSKTKTELAEICNIASILAPVIASGKKIKDSSGIANASIQVFAEYHGGKMSQDDVKSIMHGYLNQILITPTIQLDTPATNAAKKSIQDALGKLMPSVTATAAPRNMADQRFTTTATINLTITNRPPSPPTYGPNSTMAPPTLDLPTARPPAYRQPTPPNQNMRTIEPPTLDMGVDPQRSQNPAAAKSNNDNDLQNWFKDGATAKKYVTDLGTNLQAALTAYDSKLENTIIIHNSKDKNPFATKLTTTQLTQPEAEALRGSLDNYFATMQCHAEKPSMKIVPSSSQPGKYRIEIEPAELMRALALDSINKKNQPVGAEDITELSRSNTGSGLNFIVVTGVVKGNPNGSIQPFSATHIAEKAMNRVNELASTPIAAAAKSDDQHSPSPPRMR